MICRPIPETREFELVSSLLFYIGGRREIVTPGYRFRGSVPRLFWRAVVTPCDPRCLRGFCVHDWLYDHRNICKRKEADKKLKEIILEDGLGKRRAKIVYAGVRLYSTYLNIIGK